MLLDSIERRLQTSEISPAISFSIRSCLQEIQRLETKEGTREMVYELADLVLNLYEQLAETRSQVANLVALRELESRVL